MRQQKNQSAASFRPTPEIETAAAGRCKSWTADRSWHTGLYSQAFTGKGSRLTTTFFTTDGYHINTARIWGTQEEENEG